jgi:hypothetical protein
MKSENIAVRPIILVGALIALIFVVGIGLGYYTKLGWKALNIMLGLIAICSFFGIMAVPGGWSENNGFSDGRVRLALTSTLVMLYVVYFATVIFWFNVPEAKQEEIPKALFTTLADMLKIIVPFYFGATAATEIAKSRREALPMEPEK